jgi:hypothetical protein
VALDDAAEAFAAPTDAGAIIMGSILPSAQRLTSASIALQNAIIRYCLVQTTNARLDDVEEAFRAAIVAAGGIEPVAFGAGPNRSAPEELTTEVANTAFSRSRLEGIMNGRIRAPTTLPELAAEGPGLTGLPALERLLLSPPYPEVETKANRCRLALTVAANVRATATEVEGRWRTGNLDPQWTTAEPELADRLRLRDIIQAMIDVSDRLDRTAAGFAADPGNNDNLPYAKHRSMTAYLEAVSGALIGQTDVLGRFAAPASPAAETVARIAAALDQGREALGGGNRAARRTASELFDRARQEIAQLPAVFDFAPAAFQRPLASFEAVTTPAVPATPNP